MKLTTYPPKWGQTLFRSYGRCIAEFLSEGSLVSLSLLDSTHLCWFAVRAAYTTRMSTFLASAFSRIVTQKGNFHSLRVPARLDG